MRISNYDPLKKQYIKSREGVKMIVFWRHEKLNDFFGYKI